MLWYNLNMKSGSPKSPSLRQSHVLGPRKFAAITAVEGLRLSREGKERLASTKADKLTPDQRRAEVIRAYSGRKGR
jgi:hypothetical protein